MEDKLKILFNEDVKTDAELIWRELKKNNIVFKELLVDNKKDFIEGLKSFAPDLIISDYSLPQFTGMQALIIRNEMSPSTPFILVTGSNNETVAVECMKAGADDYILKDNLSRLGPSVTNSLNKCRLVEEKLAIEEALVQSEMRFKQITNHSGEWIWEVDTKGIYTFSSHIVKDILGYEPEEIINKKYFYDFFLPEEKEKLKRAALEIFARKESFKGFINRNLHKDGSIFILSTNGIPLLDKSGELTGYRGVDTDITKVIKNEEFINQERRLLRTLIDNLPDPIYVLDKEGRKVIASKADIKNMGLINEAEAIGKTDMELFPGETGIRGHKANTEVIGSGKPIIECEEDFIDKNGERCWLLTSKFPLYDKNGDIDGLVGIGHNITSRKQAQAEIMQSYELTESLLKTIPLGMDIVDEQGTVLFQSDNFKRLFGEEAIGEKCWEIYRDDKKQCSDCPLFKGIKIGGTEVFKSHGVLDNRTFEISHTGMIYKGKKAMLEIFQDITQRLISEKELIKAKEKAEESDKLKTSFLHNISHEIRTPMNAILGFSGFLGDPDLLPEKRKYFNDIIMHSCNQLLSIITDIVTIATIETGQEKIIEREINLNSLLIFLKDQFSLKAEMQNISLSTKSYSSGNDVKIRSDETKLTQVLSNLIGNAIKFTMVGSVHFGFNLKDTEIEFFVEDTGIGIAPEMHEVIFNRFRQVDTASTRQFGGSGLGLSISKSYAELLGGKIRLISEPGKGSTFFLTIPYKKPETKTITGVHSIPTIKIEVETIKNILVAEDEDSNFMLLEELLSGLGPNLIRARNGAEAVELCKSTNNIDLILMDIKMPVMDGFEATRQIRKFKPDLPIIAQTAYTEESDKKRILACGCNDIIFKPINARLLVSMLRGIKN